MKNRIFYLIAFLFVFCLQFQQVQAQMTTQIKGRVLDKDKKPVEFANVALRKAGEPAIVKGAISDAQGAYTIDGLAFGNYEIDIYFIGYQTQTLKDIQINAQNSQLKIADVELADDSKQLSEIVIEEKREMIQQTAEGIIVKPDANISNVGGTATDVLKNTPSVNVDANGNVTLRGASPNILINGRNSGFAGGGPRGGGGGFGLDQISADDIESIEISNNPSARFDADGVGGMINIRLKRDKQLGTHANFGLGYAVPRNRYNANFRINHRTKKLNVHTAYSFRRDQRIGLSETDRSTFLSSGTQILDQEENSLTKSFFHNFRLGADYFFNEKESISVEGMFGYRFNDDDENLESRFLDGNYVLDYFTLRNSLENRTGNNFEYSVIYTKQFSKAKQELSASFTSSMSNSLNKSDLDNQSFEEDGTAIDALAALQRSRGDDENTINTFQIDYAHPLSKDFLIETGYKGIIRTLDTDFDLENFDNTNLAWIFDENLSNTFLYKENVHAAYLAFKNKWKKIDFGGGLRFEKVWLTGEADENNNFNKDYFNIFPTARFAYNVSDKEFFKLSYSKRISRPNFRDLSPNIDVSNPLNIRSGNPDLNPEYIHSLEFGYSKYWNKYTLAPTVFYRQKNNAIQRIVTLDDTGVSYSRPDNIGSSRSYGLDVIGTADFVKWWNVNVGYSFFNTEVLGGNSGSDELNSNATSWSVKMVNTFVLPKNFRVQINANYNSPVAQAQGTSLERYYTDLSVQKTIMDKKGSISLSFIDMFYTLQFGGTTFGENFTQKSLFKRDTRMLMLNFRYRI